VIFAKYGTEATVGISEATIRLYFPAALSRFLREMRPQKFQNRRVNGGARFLTADSKEKGAGPISFASC